MTTTTSGTAQGDTKAGGETTTTTGTEQGKGGGQQTGTETQTQTQTGTEGTKGKEGEGATTTTTTTQEGKGAEGGKEGEAAAIDFTKLVTPEKGKEFIDQGTIDTVIDFAKRSGWSLEDAQNAINEQALMMARADDAALKELKADPDYGGDKLPVTQQHAKALIDRFRPEGHPRREAFLRRINRVAAGNDIEFVSFLADIGKAAAEDSFGQSSTASRGAQRSAEDVLYGGTKPSS